MRPLKLDYVERSLAWLLVLVAPLMYAGSFEIMNVTVRIPDLVALALIAIAFIAYALRREGLRPPTCLLLPMVAYALANVVSAAVNWGAPLSQRALRL